MLKKYNHDDAKYIGMRDVGNLFKQSLVKIITNQQKPKVLSMVITQNMNEMGTKIKAYQVKNTLI